MPRASAGGVLDVGLVLLQAAEDALLVVRLPAVVPTTQKNSCADGRGVSIPGRMAIAWRGRARRTWSRQRTAGVPASSMQEKHTSCAVWKCVAWWLASLWRVPWRTPQLSHCPSRAPIRRRGSDE